MHASAGTSAQSDKPARVYLPGWAHLGSTNESTTVEAPPVLYLNRKVDVNALEVAAQAGESLGPAAKAVRLSAIRAISALKRGGDKGFVAF